MSAWTAAQSVGQVPSTAAYQAEIAVYPAVVPVAAAAVVEVRAEEEEDRVEEETREEEAEELVATAGVTRAGIAARLPWSTQS